MKTLFASATFVAGCLAVYFLVGGANAQGPRNRPPVDHGVRVIDIKRVFDEYTAFADQIKQLREEVKIAEGQQIEAAKEVRSLVERAKQLKPGSDERKDLEKKRFKRQTDLAANAKIQKAEFMEKEAKIYFHTFNVIKGEVAYYCKVKNVSLVVQFNSEKADPNDRGSVMRSMTSTVVAQNGVDITDTILRVLNRENAKVSNRRSNVPRGRK